MEEVNSAPSVEPVVGLLCVFLGASAVNAILAPRDLLVKRCPK
jgi:hypothetical protein